MQRTLPSLQNYLFPDCDNVQTTKTLACGWYDRIIIKTSNAFSFCCCFFNVLGRKSHQGHVKLVLQCSPL